MSQTDEGRRLPDSVRGGRRQIHPALPIRSRLPIDLSKSMHERIGTVVTQLLRSDRELARSVRYESVSSGLTAGPALLIHDISQTYAAPPAGPDFFEYRALLLAGADDLVAIGVHRSPAFEAHVTELLGVDHVRVERIERATGGDLIAAAQQDEALLSEAADRARAAGHFVVRPYQATDAAWSLAADIAARSGVDVQVEGPRPAVAARVNDKVWFSAQVSAILGPGASPKSSPAEDLDQLVSRIRMLGARHERVAVRLRSGASGEGNLIIPVEAISRSPRQALAAMLRQVFGLLDWEDAFPLQVAVWEAPVLASPSVQSWIPHSGDGQPIVEGVFEQRFDDESGAFAGVVTSPLPGRLQRELANGAGALATLFQQLGYFGRCSFDAILVGHDFESAVLRWIECNGRWGGASIPMTAAERIAGDWSKYPFVVTSERRADAPRVTAADALARLGALTLRRGHDEGVLLVSPTALETGRGCDLMAIARSRSRAAELADLAREALYRQRRHSQ